MCFSLKPVIHCTSFFTYKHSVFLTLGGWIYFVILRLFLLFLKHFFIHWILPPLHALDLFLLFIYGCPSLSLSLHSLSHGITFTCHLLNIETRSMFFMQWISPLIQTWQNHCHIKMRSHRGLKWDRDHILMNRTALVFVLVCRLLAIQTESMMKTLPQHSYWSQTPQGTFNLWRLKSLYALEKACVLNPTTCHCCLQLSSQSLWDSGPESRRSSWTSIGRAPSLHRKSQSGEMESLLSDTHSSSNLSSREQSLDREAEYLQVPVLHVPDCNGTTFHLPDHCYDDAPLTTHYNSDQEEDEIEEVQLSAFCVIYFLKSKGKGILISY